ncbi:MAG: sucrose-phosphate phosphatase [Calditrichaceae bacterium]|nr:sucrose-phosphate phosphatase [Calditrichaceae bacterium]RQV96472.1 MAG: sucrose-phosphate phosphatase [Calditrichota bacterium]
MNGNKDAGLYLALISLHGLIRGENMELGRDADTGGQVRYVIELAKKLSDEHDIDRVDLFTRKIEDPKVDLVYAQESEQIAEKSYIIRIPFGPKRYLRKEVLWNYLDSFSDQAVLYFRRLGRIPDVIHGHYADAGYAGAQIARLLASPFIFTGHSLGRVKRQRLEEKGVSVPKMEARYNISHRIEAEEFALDTAAKVIVSTKQEIDEQYELYEHYDKRRKIIIPPGIDTNTFYPPKRFEGHQPIHNEIFRFLNEPYKPVILALSRADERKNIEGLIHAFGGNSYLKQNANLVILAGGRSDIRQVDPGARKVFFNILYLIDKYDLYGKIAYPKTHQPGDVPFVYRYAAKTKGVFVNPALTEPFGLTLLEAGASGLPIVATNDGGPEGIIGDCNNGLLIDPLKSDEIGHAIQKILQDSQLWRIYSRNGMRNIKRYYSWKAHTKRYVSVIKKLIKNKYYKRNIMAESKSRMPTIDRLIITDIDNTLIGDKDALQRFTEQLKNMKSNIGFGVATGRRLELTMDALKEWNIPAPDLLITSVGSEIYYGKKLVIDQSWSNRLNYQWYPEKIPEIMGKLPGLTLQPKKDQRKYKVSYFVDMDKAPDQREIIRYLREHHLKVKVIHSHEAYLDILPIRASKGLAIRYLFMKWGLTPEQVLVAGDSGNDEEMLLGDTLGVVVGNFSPELRHLYGKPRIYFAEKSYADGIIEGIEYYNFLGKIRIPEEEYAE